MTATTEHTAQFVDAVSAGYGHDKFFKNVLQVPSQHKSFSLGDDDLLYIKTNAQDKVVCVPAVQLDGRKLTEIVIETAHTVLGHLGTQKTSDYVRRWFWW
ncbi:hypothetical protein K474DRAFT_1606753, partial [Panus rudis PR-1116 ss-1]